MAVPRKPLPKWIYSAHFPSAWGVTVPGPQPQQPAMQGRALPWLRSSAHGGRGERKEQRKALGTPGVRSWGRDGAAKGGRSGYFIGVREVLTEKLTLQQRPDRTEDLCTPISAHTSAHPPVHTHLCTRTSAHTPLHTQPHSGGPGCSSCPFRGPG